VEETGHYRYTCNIESGVKNSYQITHRRQNFKLVVELSIP